MKLDRTNQYPGRCSVCGTGVPAQRGFLLRGSDVEDPALQSKKWLTLCTSKKCAASLVGEEAVAASDRRAIEADGSILLPQDEKLTAFKRAMGYWDGDARKWVVSPHRRDRSHVVFVANELRMEVDPAWAEYEDPPQVVAAVARARAVETIRDYQVEGVRWLAYRGLDDAPEIEGEYNLKDRQRGGLLCDDPGCGKTAQTLLQLHDDEALVVVAPSNGKSVWVREAKRWLPNRFDEIIECEGESSFVWADSPRTLVVLNYDILPYTPAQIKDEREHLWAKRVGHRPTNRDRGSKQKWKRKPVEGCLAVLFDLADTYSAQISRGEDKTTAGRHRLFETLETWIGQSEKVHRNALARRRNAARTPAGKPSCPVCLVGDELHYVENNKAQRTVRWRHMTGKARRVIGLTGTPVEASPLKLFGLLTSACANPFTWNSFKEQFSAYDGAYCLEFARHPPAPGSTARGAIKVEPGTTEILGRVILRRTKEQVLPELPAKVFTEIPIEITTKQRAELDEITAIYAPEILNGELPPFEATSKIRKALAKACIDKMLDIVKTYESADTPLVVFSAHRDPIEKLAKRAGWHAIIGGTKSSKRGEIQDAFQAGEGFGVAGTRAMAESITLTRASTVLQVDPFWERKYNNQAHDRVHRIGQPDSVNVLILMPDHVLVQHCASLLISKDAFVDATLHGAGQTPDHGSLFTDEDDSDWRARVEAKRAKEQAAERRRQQRELARRELAIAKISEREVTPQLSEKRAKARAAKLGAHTLHHDADKSIVRAALAHMLAVCDGAVTKDNVGFNKPDGCVARWLAPGVEVGSKYAVASAAAILRRYPRQLSSEYPALYMH